MAAKLRYACIGAGGIADKKHLNEYAKLAEIELAAICDPNLKAAEKLAEKYGIPKVYADYRELLEEESLDLVSICTPNYLHAPITIEALEKGVNVHCEKPLALNAQEAQAIVEAKNRYHRKVMVGLNNRFSNESLFVKKYADAGLFGEIYHVKCGWRRRNGIPGKGAWFTDKKLSGGGALIDLGVHFLDLVLHFMGYPAVASVSGAVYSKFGNSSNRLRPGYKNNGDGRFDVEDMAVGMVRMDNHATLDFEFSWASNIEKETKYYELLGTKGGVSFRDGELKIFSEVLDTSINVVPEMNSSVKSVNEFEHFTECIRSGREPMASPEQAVRLMQIIDGLYLSDVLKKEVHLQNEYKDPDRKLIMV
jgi:predicted dehydrogenase